MMVTFGIDNDCMSIIDSGNSRSVSDRLFIAGRSPLYRSTNIHALVRYLDQEYRGFNKHGMKYSLDELCNSIDYWQGICQYCLSMRHRNYRISAPLTVSLVRAMINGVTVERIEAFIRAYTRCEIDTSIPDVNWKPAIDIAADKYLLKYASGTRTEEAVNKFISAINAFDMNLKRVRNVENRYPATLIDMKKWSDDHIDYIW